MIFHLRQVVVGLAAAGLVVSACRAPAQNPANGPTPTPRPISVSVQPVERGDVQTSFSYTGSVQASKQVNIIPQVGAKIRTLDVDVGSAVKAGQVIATLDSTALEAQVKQAQAGVDAAQAKVDQIEAGPRPATVAQAQANLAAAQAKLASIKDGGRPETIAQAQANVAAAQAKLDQLKAGPTAGQIKAAQLAVDQAKNTLYSTQVNKDGACNPHNPKYLCDAAQASANAAQTAVDLANQQLLILTSPPTKEALQQAQAGVDAAQQQLLLAKQPATQHDIDQAQAAVDAAQQQLLLAKQPATQHDIDQAQAAVDGAAEQVKLAQQPYTDQDVKAAEATVEQARATLDLAKIQLGYATITAPVDGVVSQKLLDVGNMASPGSPIVTLVSRAVEVTINVEEAKLGLVTPDQAASVTVSAYPNQPFPAKVVGEPPVVDAKSRTAVVRLSPTDPKGMLKPGMFAQVTLASTEHKGILLVPQSAIVTNNNQTSVYVVTSGVIKVQPIQTGLSDGSNVEAVSGLSEGQIVVVGDKPTLHDGDKVTPELVGR